MARTWLLLTWLLLLASVSDRAEACRLVTGFTSSWPVDGAADVPSGRLVFLSGLYDAQDLWVRDASQEEVPTMELGRGLYAVSLDGFAPGSRAAFEVGTGWPLSLGIGASGTFEVPSAPEVSLLEVVDFGENSCSAAGVSVRFHVVPSESSEALEVEVDGERGRTWLRPFDDATRVALVGSSGERCFRFRAINAAGEWGAWSDSTCAQASCACSSTESSAGVPISSWLLLPAICLARRRNRA